MWKKHAFSVALLTVGSLASAQDEAEATGAARTLEVVAGALDRTLQDADVAVARAAGDLGRTGLRGEQAHARLAALCEELTYAVTCSAIDDQGVLVSEAPAAFTGVEGRDVGAQAHVRRLQETREPVLSDAFRSVEGFDAVSLAHPVYGGDGRFLGSVSMMARPGSLIGHAVKPVLTEGAPEVMVGQKDGYVLYDPDAEEIGRNLFTDPMYTAYPELQAAVRRMVGERQGTSEYRFLGRGLTPPVHKRIHWTTVTLRGTEWRAAVAESLDAGPAVARSEDLPVPAEAGLEALIATADGHMSAIVEDLERLASGADVRSGEWTRIEAPLRRVTEGNVPAVYWYAETDGSYWTVGEGRAGVRLSDRPYFQKVLAGEPVVGDLVVSKATGRTTGIVAVPVRGDDGEVRGVLGASVYLDQLSARVRDELALADGMWFYAFDTDHRLALYPDQERIFLRAGELGPEVEPWFTEMQARGEGVIRYTYEGRPRALVFRRSPVTGWMYAYGYIGEPPTGA